MAQETAHSRLRMLAEVSEQVVVGAAFVGEHRAARAALNQGPVEERTSRRAALKSAMPIMRATPLRDESISAS